MENIEQWINELKRRIEPIDNEMKERAIEKKEGNSTHVEKWREIIKVNIEQLEKDNKLYPNDPLLFNNANEISNKIDRLEELLKY